MPSVIPNHPRRVVQFVKGSVGFCSGEQHVPACTLPALHHSATLPSLPATCNCNSAYSIRAPNKPLKKPLEKKRRQHLQPKIAGTLSSSCVTTLRRTYMDHAHQGPPSPPLIGFPAPSQGQGRTISQSQRPFPGPALHISPSGGIPGLPGRAADMGQTQPLFLQVRHTRRHLQDSTVALPLIRCTLTWRRCRTHGWEKESLPFLSSIPYPLGRRFGPTADMMAG